MVQAAKSARPPLKNFKINLAFQPQTLTFAAPLKNSMGLTTFFKHKIREMNNYELMVIFTPVLSEEEYKAAQSKYAALVTDNGGTVLHTNPWGLKSLAYPIAKKTTGLYWVLEYSAPTNFNEKLKTQILRDESIMRHMYTVLDKYAVEYNAKKRGGVQSKKLEKAEA